MWAALLGFLQALPKLLDLGEALAKSIASLIELQRERNQIEKTKVAMEAAVATKDTSKIEELLRGGFK